MDRTLRSPWTTALTLLPRYALVDGVLLASDLFVPTEINPPVPTTTFADADAPTVSASTDTLFALAMFT